MTKKFLALLLALALTVGVSAQAGFLLNPYRLAAGDTVVTDSLEMHLDAGNSSSWSGSGNWQDLTNAYDWTITGATFNGTPGGGSSSEYWSSDGSGDYFDLASAHSGTILRQMGKTTVPYTLEMWIYTKTGNDQMYFGNNFSGGSGWVYVKSNTSGASPTDKMSSATPDNGTSVNVETNAHSNDAWHQIAITCQLDGATTCTFYKDGAANGTFTDTGFTATDSGHVPRMWARPSDAVLQAVSGTRLAIVRIYSKILSGAEVLQNFNADKTRFGL